MTDATTINASTDHPSLPTTDATTINASTDRSSRPTIDATTINTSTDHPSLPTTDATTKRRKKQQRRRSKRIRHKNGDYAMTMDVVTTHLIERGIITKEQANSPDFSIRFSEKSDWSGTTQKDVQQKVLYLCRYGLLARWVLQDDGSRKLVIVRCSGVEGHHKDTPSSWVNEESSPNTRNHRLYNKGPMKKDTFLDTGETWLMKTCTRERAGRLDSAPLVNGDRHIVECLIAAANGYQLTFGAPHKRAMNGEITLVNGDLGLYTQDGVDKVLNTPIINDGSNGKLVVLITNIEERSKLNPMLHGRSSRTDKEKFMAAKHVTLNGKNTSNQSTGLENMIHRMQMPIYEKGLGKLANISAEEAFAKGYTKRTPDKHRADSSKNPHKKGLAKRTAEQHSTAGKKANAIKRGDKRSGFDRLNIRTNEKHGVASGETIIHGKCGIGIVKTVMKPNGKQKGYAMVQFENKPSKLTKTSINAMAYNRKRCQFVKEYKNPIPSQRESKPYLLFSFHIRPSVKEENPEASFGDIARIISAKYKALDDCVKGKMQQFISDSKKIADRHSIRRGKLLEPNEEELSRTHNKRALLRWYEQCNDLKSFWKKHGHCNVPRSDKKFGQWINIQRLEKRKYEAGRKTSMTDEKLQCLADMDFQWCIQDRKALWDQRFEELEKFKEEHGHCRVPFRFPTPLGVWVSRQKNSKLRASNSKERVAKLRSIGLYV